MNSEKIIDKVKAILRKADEGRNPSEAERNTALEMAQRLLIKHGLSMQDLGDVDDTDERKFAHGRVPGEPVESWRADLLWNIAPVFFCKAYFIQTGAKGRYAAILAGRTEHVALLTETFRYIADQIEGMAVVEASKYHVCAQYARVYCEAVAEATHRKWDNDEQLASIGQQRMDLLGKVSGEEQLDEISRYTGRARAYAGEIRPYLKRGEIAPAKIDHMGTWKRSFYRAAIIRVRKRLLEFHKEEVKAAGNPGKALVRNEEAALTDFWNSLGIELETSSSSSNIDYDGIAAGDRAGRSADISGGKKVPSGGRNQLNA